MVTDIDNLPSIPCQLSEGREDSVHLSVVLSASMDTGKAIYEPSPYPWVMHQPNESPPMGWIPHVKVSYAGMGIFDSVQVYSPGFCPSIVESLRCFTFRPENVTYLTEIW